MSKGSLKRMMQRNTQRTGPTLQACANCGNGFPAGALMAGWCEKCRARAQAGLPTSPESVKGTAEEVRRLDANRWATRTYFAPKV